MVASPRNQFLGRSPQLPPGTFLNKSYPRNQIREGSPRLGTLFRFCGGFCLEHDLFRPGFARRSVAREHQRLAWLRAGGKTLFGIMLYWI
jgi:hypothetical protein